MAVYGRSLYGTSEYGPDLRLVPPPPAIDVVARDRHSIELTWGPVGSDVTAVAIVRSLWGVPTNIAAGQIIAQWTYDVGTYIDTHVAPGVRYYYGLFLLTGTGWTLASGGTVLMPRDHLYSKLFDEAVPPLYYRRTSKDLIDILAPIVDPENEALTRFLDILAIGMDSIHTAVDATTDAANAYEVDDRVVDAMGDSVGVSVTSTAVRGAQRDLIAHAGQWAATRGTSRGIEAVATAVTGWRCEVDGIVNLLVDQATTDGQGTNALAFRTSGTTVTTWGSWSSGTRSFPAGSLVSITGANAGTYVNIGPDTLVQSNATVTDANAPGVHAQWSKVTDVTTSMNGGFSAEMTTVDTVGNITSASNSSSVSYATVSGGPLPYAWTWSPGAYSSKSTPSGTTLSKGLAATVSPATLGSQTYPSFTYATPLPNLDDDQVLVASFWTNVADAYPTIFGFDFYGNPTLQNTRSNVPQQWVATVTTDGPLRGVVDPQAKSDAWVVQGDWFGRAENGGTTVYPSTASGRVIALAAKSMRQGSIYTTLSRGVVDGMGVILGYLNNANYFYCTGTKFVTRLNNVETTYNYTTPAVVGQRLWVSFYDSFGSSPAQTAIVVKADGVQLYSTTLTRNLPGARAGLIKI